MIRSCLIWFMALGAVPAFSQDQAALRLQVETRIVNLQGQTDWSNTVDRTLLDGQPVTVRIGGENFRLKVVFTVYLQDPENALLVVRTEMSHGDGAAAGVKQSVQTQRVKPGVPLTFHPLGRDSRSQEGHKMLMEILVSLNPPAAAP